MSFLSALSGGLALYPPITLLYVGASPDNLLEYWPDIEPSSIVVASAMESMQMESVQKRFKNANLLVESVAISSSNKDVTFFEMNLGEYSGLIAPEAFKSYWKNIKTIDTMQHKAITVDDLSGRLPLAEGISFIANWLFIDSFNGLDALSGAANTLLNCDGIICRVCIQPDTKSFEELSLSEEAKISQFMLDAGFKHILTSTGRHKHIAYALYLKDWKLKAGGHESEARAKQQEVESLEVEVSTLTERVQTLSDLEGELVGIATQQKAAIAKLNNESDAQVKEFMALEAQYSESNEKLQLETKKTAKLKTDIGKAEVDREELKVALSKEAAKLQDIKEVLSITNDKRTSLEKDKAASLEELKRVRSQLEKMTQQYEERSAEVADVNYKLTQTERGTQALKVENANLTSEKMTLTNILEAFDQKYVAQQEFLTDNFQSLASSISTVTSDQNGVASITGALEGVDKKIEQINNLTRANRDDLRDLRSVELSQVVGHKSSVNAAYLKSKADRFYEIGNYTKAYDYYFLAASTDPKDGWALQGQAEALSRFDLKSDANFLDMSSEENIRNLGRWDVVVRLYRKAIACSPGVAIAFNQRFPTPVHVGENHEEIGAPVFIIGCGHSGTSILLRVLGEHPALWPVQKESAMFLKTDKQIESLMNGWDKACLETGGKAWIEKTPPHIFQISRFQQMRPGAKFIFIIRDGRDVVYSLRNRQGYENVADRIDRWVFDNYAGLAFKDDPNLLMVKYEDFVEKPKSVVSEICNFLKIDKNIDLMGFHKDKKNWYADELKKPKKIKENKDHNTLRNWQVNQPIFDGRMQWKEGLTEQEKNAFKASDAQPLLEELGYETGADW